MTTQIKTQSDKIKLTRYFSNGEECIAITTSYNEQITLTKKEALILFEDLIDFELETE